MESSLDASQIGAQFLHDRTPTLHTTHPVEHEQKRRKINGEKVSQNPADKLDAWMEVLERTHMEHVDDPDVFERIKEYYHLKHVTLSQEDIPQSYWNNKAEMLIMQGQGQDMIDQGVESSTYYDEEGNEHIDYIFPDELKDNELKIILSNQRNSLDRWLDYLTSDDALYPMWAKYWAFTSMLQMGKFIKKEEDGIVRGSFQIRDKTTINAFPLLNAQALAKTIGTMSALLVEQQKVKVERQKPRDRQDESQLQVIIDNSSMELDDDEFVNLLNTKNFRKIYAQFLLEIPEYSTENLKIIDGKWKVYDQGSDPTELVESLQGYPNEWCTADYDTAETQLQMGDFLVYYSNDQNGNPTIPRLAIRMIGKNQIAEPPRGIAPDQHLDPYISPVLEKKLTEFGEEGELFKKRIADMQKLTTIWEKNRNGEEFTIEDLRFLYEIDSRIEGFGYTLDPRIKEIISSRRDIKADLSTITGLAQDQISINRTEALSGNILLHYGDLDLRDLSTAEGLTLPASVMGDLDLSGLSTAEGLTLPASVMGNLYLSRLSKANGLTFPALVRGELDLSSLREANGLTLPASVMGYLDLSSLSKANGLTFPALVMDDLDLSSLTEANDLTLPASVRGYLNLSSLSKANGLTLPASVWGDLDLRSLTEANDLTLPASVMGYLDLSSLREANGLTFPASVMGNLDLSSLSKANGLTFPTSVGGDLDLRSLKEAKGLTFPTSVRGDLDLRSLSEAEGLTFPDSVGGSFYLTELRSVNGLILPTSVGGDLILQRVFRIEGLILPTTIGGVLDLEGLIQDDVEIFENIYPHFMDKTKLWYHFFGWDNPNGPNHKHSAKNP